MVLSSCFCRGYSVPDLGLCVSNTISYLTRHPFFTTPSGYWYIFVSRILCLSLYSNNLSGKFSLLLSGVFSPSLFYGSTSRMLVRRYIGPSSRTWNTWFLFPVHLQIIRVRNIYVFSEIDWLYIIINDEIYFNDPIPHDYGMSLSYPRTYISLTRLNH